jgi:hypothetical protein
MSEPATADCIRVLCLGACAEKWRMAEWESVFMTAEDMLGGGGEGLAGVGFEERIG